MSTLVGRDPFAFGEKLLKKGGEKNLHDVPTWR
jgi:hypothetical protein